MPELAGAYVPGLPARQTHTVHARNSRSADESPVGDEQRLSYSSNFHIVVRNIGRSILQG